MAKILSLLFISLVITAPLAQSALTCGQVASAIAPCTQYISSGGATVPAPCCSGAKSIFNAAKTKDDRQQVCKCLKLIAANFRGLNIAYAAAIPGKCGFQSPFPISLSTDCNSVN